MNLLTIIRLVGFLNLSIAFQIATSSLFRATKVEHSGVVKASLSASDTNLGTFYNKNSSDTLFDDGFSELIQNSENLESVEFVSADQVKDNTEERARLYDEDAVYPVASILRQSARFIADHRRRTAVFYVPGDYIQRGQEFSNLMGDIALSWILGLKIVLVVGCQYNDSCSLDFSNYVECYNSLRITDESVLKTVEETAGFVRFEVERVLNRHLRLQGALSSTSSEDAPALTGNIIGGNFYSARSFGVIDGVDYKNTGYPTKIFKERIENALDNNSIVLLSTVGANQLGDMVNVNGHYLAAKVAATLQSRKLVYVSNGDAVLRRKGETSKTMQEIPKKFCESLLDYYGIRINKYGHASMQWASTKLDENEGAIETLFHLAWSTWALNQGVNRAHIVNPGDGSLLEELFTSKLGMNTCIYQEDKAEDLDIEDDEDDFFTLFES